MSSPRVSPLLRIFPSLTDVAFLAPIFLLFFRLDGVKTMLGDGDSGWHIRAGEWMLANGRVPDTDLFSFTKAGEPWYAWEWLADVILAVLHQRFGLGGPVFLGIVLLAFTSALLFRLCRRHTGNDFLAIAVTCVTIGATSIHWLARPHLFTFLFLVLSLGWIDRSFANRRILWCFPPLVVLWTNLHGAFFVSIILLLTVGAGMFLHSVLSAENRGVGEAWRSARTYFSVAAACGAASLVNPYGWLLHQHIYEYLTEQYHFEHIMEFQTMSFHSPVAMYFEALLVAGLFAAGWSVTQRRFADALLLVTWLHLALMAARNIPLYAFVAAPIVTRFLSEGFRRVQTASVAEWLRKAAVAWEAYAGDFTRMDRIPRFHLTSGLGMLILLICMMGAPADSDKLKSEFDPKKYPAGALSLLDGRRVFTNDEWGDYLIYKLYPKTKVFVDGRSDFYGGEFSLKYLDVMNGHWDWASILSRHKVDAVLLPAASSLASTLKATSTWRTVYDDQISILFFASEGKTHHLRDSKTAMEIVSKNIEPGAKIRNSIKAALQPQPQL